MFRAVPTPPGATRRATTVPHLRPTHQRRLAVMGQALLFQTNQPALLAAAVDTFGGFGPPPPDETPLVVQILVRPGPSPPATEPRRQRPVVHTQGHLLSLSYGAEDTAVADLERGFAFAVISSRLAQDVPFVRYALIEALPQILLGVARGYVAVHAACVVRHGVSVLIQAPAGTGKSTLAYACLRRGFQVLAEDVVQVQARPETPVLWGMPWRFHLLPDAVTLFPELAAVRPRRQAGGVEKLEIDLGVRFPQQTLTRADPGVVVFLQRAVPDAETGLEPLSPAAARAAFEVIWSWDLGWRETYEAAVQTLLAQGAYRLTMNGLPDEAVDLLVSLTAAGSPPLPAGRTA